MSMFVSYELAYIYMYMMNYFDMNIQFWNSENSFVGTMPHGIPYVFTKIRFHLALIAAERSPASIRIDNIVLLHIITYSSDSFISLHTDYG